MLKSPLLLVVISFSFRWIASCFLESLGHCTDVLLVWFSRSDSVSDPDTWGEISLIGVVCNSTSYFCLNSGVRVLLLIILVEFLCKSIKWVSWGFCQTIPGIWWNLVFSGRSTAAPEWRRGIFSFNFGLQLEQVIRFTLIGSSWTWFCLSGLLCQGDSLLVALAPW